LLSKGAGMLSWVMAFLTVCVLAAGLAFGSIASLSPSVRDMCLVIAALSAACLVAAIDASETER
jgi:uncharacterized membrane protein YtjA (UPF0391 family)